MISMATHRDAVAFSLRQGEPRRLEAMIEQRQLDFAITRLPVVNAALHVLPSAVLTRAGFSNSPLDGGLPLLQLFSPTLRFSSAMRACSAVIAAHSSAFCCRSSPFSRRSDASSASGDAEGDDVVAPAFCESEAPGGDMESLIQALTRLSSADLLARTALYLGSYDFSYRTVSHWQTTRVGVTPPAAG
jgi:hypothetical protein